MLLLLNMHQFFHRLGLNIVFVFAGPKEIQTLVVSSG